MNSLKSICILRLSSIGDVTHIVPIINTIKEKCPSTQLTWIIGSVEHELVKNIKNVDFVVIDKKNFLSTIKKLHTLKKRNYFDVLLHMQVSMRSNIISMMINAKRKVGFNTNISKNLHSLFINEKIPIQEKMHVADTFFLFLEKIGLTDHVLSWDINTNTDNKILVKKKYFVVNPFTSQRSFNYREWDINNYKIVAEYVNDNFNLDMVVVGGNSVYEKEMSEALCCANFIHNYVGKTNLSEVYKIIQHSDFYLGPDSGTLHIASMLGKKIIGLYATSNPYRTGPYNNLNYIINKYPTALKVYKKKNINNVRWGERVRHKNAMSLISIQEVKEKVDKILRF